MLTKIKTIKSHAGHARFLAECADDDFGWIPAQSDIPSPYAFQQEWAVYDWNGTAVVIRETAHKQYDVFAVPEQMIRNYDPIVAEQESNYLRNLGV